MKSGSVVKNLSFLPLHQVQFNPSSSAAALVADGARQSSECQRGEETI
jgi:hypothetical protein